MRGEIINEYQKLNVMDEIEKAFEEWKRRIVLQNSHSLIDQPFETFKAGWMAHAQVVFAQQAGARPPA